MKWYEWILRALDRTGDSGCSPLREALSTRGLLAGQDNVLAVVVGGELVGRVEWLERRWGRRDTSLCWEMAVGILPEWRGRGVGTQAQQELVRYLLTHTRVERVQATTRTFTSTGVVYGVAVLL
jgi:aminoglycoside 6'-N-acetyltransferase